MAGNCVAGLSKIKNIIGIKEATGDLQRLAEIKALVADDFVLYSGDDETACDFILQGGHGVISVTSNVAPVEMAKMCSLALDGQTEAAQEINAQLLPVHKNLFVEANPIPVKWALQEMHLMGGGIRLPLTPLAESCHTPLREAMQQAGIL